jgi:hypothetical protein
LISEYHRIFQKTRKADSGIPVFPKVYSICRQPYADRQVLRAEVFGNMHKKIVDNLYIMSIEFFAEKG